MSGGSAFGGATSSAIEREGGGVRPRPEAAECAGEEDKVEERKRKERKVKNRANRNGKKKLESHGPQRAFSQPSSAPRAWVRTMTCAAELAIVLVHQTGQEKGMQRAGSQWVVTYISPNQALLKSRVPVGIQTQPVHSNLQN